MLAKTPGFDQLDSRSTNPAFWSEMYLDAARELSWMADADGERLNPIARLAQASAKHGEARRILIDAGVEAHEANGMPMAKALLLSEKILYQKYSQRAAVLLALPWYRRPKVSQRDDEIASASMTGGLWFKSLDIARTHVSFERSLRALQTIEALRDYASKNDGAFPTRLSDLVDTPAPDDPTTGQPFQYEVKGDVASIDSPDLGDGRPFGYDIRIKRN